MRLAAENARSSIRLEEYEEPALDPAKVDPVAVADEAAVVLVTNIIQIQTQAQNVEIGIQMHQKQSKQQ